MNNQNNGKDTTMVKFVKSIDKFWNTKFSFVFFTIIVLVVATVQLSLFLSGFVISNVTIDSNNSWIGWTYIAISLPAVLLACYAEIYTIRVDKKFFWFAFIADVTSIFTSAIGGMVWTSMMLVIVKVISVYRYYLISKFGKDYKVNEKLLNTIGMLVSSSLMLLGLILINVLPSGILWWDEELSLLSKYLDVICSSLILFGVTLLTTKNKHAYSIFFLCDFMFIIAFALVAQWLTVLQTTLYTMINILGYLAWSFKHKHPEIWDKESEQIIE